MDPSPSVEDAIIQLERWLRQEVAPIIAGGGNWKAILNGRGASDIGFVVERHGQVVRRTAPTDANKIALS